MVLFTCFHPCTIFLTTVPPIIHNLVTATPDTNQSSDSHSWINKCLTRFSCFFLTGSFFDVFLLWGGGLVVRKSRSPPLEHPRRFVLVRKWQPCALGCDNVVYTTQQRQAVQDPPVIHLIPETEVQLWYKQGKSRRWWEVEQSKNGGSMWALTTP